MSETTQSPPASEADPIDAPVEAVAAPSTPDAPVSTLTDAPARPTEGGLHELFAWLEARMAWLEGKL